MESPLQLTDDDRPPTPGPRRPHRGVVWASALAVVVLAIATIVAFTSGKDSSAPNGPTAILDNNAPPPTLAPGDGTSQVGQALPVAIRFEPFSGGSASFADYGKKPLVINFWSSTCTPCITEMPDLERAHQQYGDQVSFIGFDVQEQQSAGQELASRTGVTYDLARDPTGEILRGLGGIVLPTTVLVNAEGTIVEVHSGQISAADLDQAVRQKLLS